MYSKQTCLLIERLGVVKKYIESGIYPSSSVLIETVLNILDMEVSVSTIYRDIDFLRSRCAMNICFDSSKKRILYLTRKGSMNGLNNQNPNEVIGKVVRIVCGDKVLMLYAVLVSCHPINCS